MSAGGVRASANFNDLNASSIERAQSEDNDRFGDINIISQETERKLQERVATLEDEIVNYKIELATLKEKETEGSQKSTIQQKQLEDVENFNHIKSLVLQFISSVPYARYFIIL